MLCWMDARLESRYLSNNYTTRNLSEDIIKLKTCLKILIFSSYVKSADPQVSRLRSIVNWFGYNKRKRNIIEPFQLILIDSVKWFSGIFWNECDQITLNSHIGKKINTHFKLFGFQIFGFERICWRLFHKRAVNSKCLLFYYRKYWNIQWVRVPHRFSCLCCVLFVFVLYHVCPILQVSLDCPILIAPSVFNQYVDVIIAL